MDCKGISFIFTKHDYLVSLYKILVGDGNFLFYKLIPQFQQESSAECCKHLCLEGAVYVVNDLLESMGFLDSV